MLLTPNLTNKNQMGYICLHKWLQIQMKCDGSYLSTSPTWLTASTFSMAISVAKRCKAWELYQIWLVSKETDKKRPVVLVFKKQIHLIFIRIGFLGWNVGKWWQPAYYDSVVTHYISNHEGKLIIFSLCFPTFLPHFYAHLQRGLLLSKAASSRSCVSEGYAIVFLCTLAEELSLLLSKSIWDEKANHISHHNPVFLSSLDSSVLQSYTLKSLTQFDIQMHVAA